LIRKENDTMGTAKRADIEAMERELREEDEEERILQHPSDPRYLEVFIKDYVRFKQRHKRKWQP
jgi:hypothetical protein